MMDVSFRWNDKEEEIGLPDIIPCVRDVMISCSVGFVLAFVDPSGSIEWTELGNTKHTKAFIFCHDQRTH